MLGLWIGSAGGKRGKLFRETENITVRCDAILENITVERGVVQRVPGLELEVLSGVLTEGGRATVFK